MVTARAIELGSVVFWCQTEEKKNRFRENPDSSKKLLTEKQVNDIISLAPDRTTEGADKAQANELEQLKSGKETKEHIASQDFDKLVIT